MNQNHTWLFYLNLQREVCVWSDRWGGAGRRLLGIGGAAEHLADSLGDGVAVDAVDLEQLVGFAATGNVGHSQTVQAEARLIDHCWAHCLPKATCRTAIYHVRKVKREDKSSLKDEGHPASRLNVCSINEPLYTHHIVYISTVYRRQENITSVKHIPLTTEA